MAVFLDYLFGRRFFDADFQQALIHKCNDQLHVSLMAYNGFQGNRIWYDNCCNAGTEALRIQRESTDFGLLENKNVQNQFNSFSKFPKFAQSLSSTISNTILI